MFGLCLIFVAKVKILLNLSYSGGKIVKEMETVLGPSKLEQDQGFQSTSEETLERLRPTFNSTMF